MRYLLLTLTLSFTAAACGGTAPQAPPFKAVAETKDIMDNVMERQADIVWGAAGQIITLSGGVGVPTGEYFDHYARMLGRRAVPRRHHRVGH